MKTKYIGIDMSHEYCKLARERMAVFENQPALFMEEKIYKKVII